MKIGIVGLPNAGKTTLFNALTRAGAETAAYPFTTVDPNVAIVAVPDERLAAVAGAAAASPLVPETIEFHDIAGLVRGAAAGEGLGNRFLGAIRETDAICHVIRAHGDQLVPHPAGHADPVADAETVEAELLLADLEQAERRLERVRKQAGSGVEEEVAERDWLERVVEALARGRPVREIPVPAAGARRAGPPSGVELQAGPLRGQRRRGDRQAARGAGGARRRLGGLHRDQRADRGRAGRAAGRRGRRDARRARRSASRASSCSFAPPTTCSSLVTFFTAHRGSEARARALRRGSSAWDAAGKVHTDIQAGFVRAEVIDWRELVEAGGYAAARDRGLIRTEGRDYVVRRRRRDHDPPLNGLREVPAARAEGLGSLELDAG